MIKTPGRVRPTIVTLARSAGVSASTVSRALKDDGRISPPMRARIARLAADSGYLPNIMARSLSSGRSGLLGLVLGPLDNPVQALLFEALLREAGRRGQRFLMIPSGQGARADGTAHALLHCRVDGCLVIAAEPGVRAADVCAANGVPVVMINRPPHRGATSVARDEREGARLLGAHLRGLGHRRAAILHSGPRSASGVTRERGFLRGFLEAGGRVVERLDARSGYAGGFAAGEALARMPPRTRPDCVFAVSDVIAMGAMDGLRGQGIGVPGDLSVAGFDGIPEGGRPAHALTSYRPPLAQLAAQGLDLLAARIDQPGLSHEAVLLPGELLLRGSVHGPARGPRRPGPRGR